MYNTHYLNIYIYFFFVVHSVVLIENISFKLLKVSKHYLKTFETRKHQIQSLDTLFEGFLNILSIEKVSADLFKYSLLLYRDKFYYNLTCCLIYSEFIQICMFECIVIWKWLEIWQIV